MAYDWLRDSERADVLARVQDEWPTELGMLAQIVLMEFE